MILKNWLLEARRVTKPHGRLALNIPLDTSSPFPRPTYAEALHAALWAGWQYRFTIIWDEGNTSKGNRSLGSVNSSARPHHISPVEMIPVFSNGEWGPTSDGRDDITPDEWQAWGRGIWSFSGESSAWEGHPAAFPLELPRRLIRYLCRVGDVVLDPFVGSGTTVLAAIQLGRQAIGVDRSQQYVDSTLRRLATHGARPGAVGTPSTGAGVPGTRAETGESGGLRSGLDRGARGAPEHERLPAGATGVAV
jgi:site-specific DNA-methyltransferase (adenine-specific)